MFWKCYQDSGLELHSIHIRYYMILYMIWYIMISPFLDFAWRLFLCPPCSPSIAFTDNSRRRWMPFAWVRHVRSHWVRILRLMTLPWKVAKTSLDRVNNCKHEKYSKITYNYFTQRLAWNRCKVQWFEGRKGLTACSGEHEQDQQEEVRCLNILNEWAE